MSNSNPDGAEEEGIESERKLDDVNDEQQLLQNDTLDPSATLEDTGEVDNLDNQAKQGSISSFTDSDEEEQD